MIVNRKSLGKENFNVYDWEYREVDGKIILTNYIGVSENVVFPKGERFSVQNNVFSFGPMRNIVKSIDFNEIKFEIDIPFILHDLSDKLEVVKNYRKGIKNFSRAFNGTYNLVKISIPEGAEDFTGAFSTSGLEEPVELPKSTLYMNAAYYQCQKLKKTGNIPENVIELDNTFYKTSVEHGADLSKHNNLKSLNGCYNWCSSLEDTGELPDNVFNMAEAYSHCYRLERVSKLPEHAKIYFMTFYDCNKLKSQPKINKDAKLLFGTFDQCVKLVYAKEIPYGALTTCCMYSGCIRLEVGADIPDSVINCSDMYNGCVKLKRGVKIGRSVITADSLYTDCQSLEYAPDIPDNVKTADFMFSKCYRLRRAPQIGKVITAIRMFDKCVSMQSAPIIPETVIDITEMFRNCVNLSGDIVILSKQIIRANNLLQGLENSKYHKKIYVDFDSQTYTTLVKTGLTEQQKLYNIEVLPLKEWLNGKSK